MTATQSNPANALIDVISALLVPMFLIASNGDVALARTAAIQTVSAYRVQNQVDLVTVAQILAFGLGALGSLALSMADDLSLSMILRLRGNANACSRSAEQHRRALRASPEAIQDAPSAIPEPRDHSVARTCATQAQSPDPPTATPAPAQPQASAPVMPVTADQQRRTLWAATLPEAATDCNAKIPCLAPAQQKAVSVRAAALNSTATTLLSGVDLAPCRPKPIMPPKDVKPR